MEGKARYRKLLPPTTAASWRTLVASAGERVAAAARRQRPAESPPPPAGKPDGPALRILDNYTTKPPSAQLTIDIFRASGRLNCRSASAWRPAAPASSKTAGSPGR
jgi:hypothetical protein